MSSGDLGVLGLTVGDHGVQLAQQRPDDGGTSLPSGWVAGVGIITECVSGAADPFAVTPMSRESVRQSRRGRTRQLAEEVRTTCRANGRLPDSVKSTLSQATSNIHRRSRGSS